MSVYFGSLPKNIIKVLKKASGVDFQQGYPGDVSVIDLTDSVEGTSIYMQWLLENDDIDPGVVVNFGNPVNPWVNVNCQVEVHGLLNTFRTLSRTDFVAGAVLPAFNPGPGFPPGGGYVFHHSSIALHMVVSEIQTPIRYAVSCPFLLGVPVGNLICMITMTYANCMVVMSVNRR